MFEGQEFFPTPDMIGQADDHGRCPPSIALPIGQALGRLPQGWMRSQPVMFQQTDRHQPIPGRGLFRKSMRSARQGVPPVSQHAVQPFLMHPIREGHRFPPHRAYLHADHPAAATLLDHLRQPHPRRRNQWRTSAPPRSLRVAVSAADLAAVHRPPIADPGHTSLLMGALSRLAQPLWRRFIFRTGRGPRHQNGITPLDNEKCGAALGKATTLSPLRLSSFTLARI